IVRHTCREFRRYRRAGAFAEQRSEQWSSCRDVHSQRAATAEFGADCRAPETDHSLTIPDSRSWSGAPLFGCAALFGCIVIFIQPRYPPLLYALCWRVSWHIRLDVL